MSVRRAGGPRAPNGGKGRQGFSELLGRATGHGIERVMRSVKASPDAAPTGTDAGADPEASGAETGGSLRERAILPQPERIGILRKDGDSSAHEDASGSSRAEGAAPESMEFDFTGRAAGPGEPVRNPDVVPEPRGPAPKPDMAAENHAVLRNSSAATAEAKAERRQSEALRGDARLQQLRARDDG